MKIKQILSNPIASDQPSFMRELGALKDGSTMLYPWADANTAMLWWGRSAMKEASPLLESMVDPFEATLDATIAAILNSMFRNKWVRLYDVTKAEYAALENYNMEEVETPNLTRQETETPDITHTEDETQKSDSTASDVGQTSAQGQTGIYGFNSSSAAGDDTTETVGSTQSEASQAATGERKRTTTETGTRNRVYSDTGERKLTRRGNIGVTTSQQMLESEIALWQWVFLDEVFADIDKVLCCPSYGGLPDD